MLHPKIPDDAELGEKLIEICLHILTKQSMTKTKADDQLLETDHSGKQRLTWQQNSSPYN